MDISKNGQIVSQIVTDLFPIITAETISRTPLIRDGLEHSRVEASQTNIHSIDQSFLLILLGKAVWCGGGFRRRSVLQDDVQVR